jgi:SAM-dependent methyltransferase
MAEINLLAKLPKARRDVNRRHVAKTAENVAIAKQFGQAYFDGPREVGYGGYRYDGRWIPVAEDIVRHFALKSGDRVLDVGCGKGFLVKDLMQVCPGLEVFGVDISEYALLHCEPEVVGRLHLGSAEKLPFPDRSFQAVLSINTIHNLPRESDQGSRTAGTRTRIHSGGCLSHARTTGAVHEVGADRRISRLPAGLAQDIQ